MKEYLFTFKGFQRNVFANDVGSAKVKVRNLLYNTPMWFEEFQTIHRVYEDKTKSRIF